MLKNRLSKEQVIGVLNELFLGMAEVSGEKLDFTQDFNIEEVLCLDSLDIVEVIMDIEVELDIDIFDEEIEALQEEGDGITYFKLIDYVMTK